MDPTQANRFLSIGTPLKEDVLLIRGFSMNEQLGRLYQIEVDLVSTKGDIKFEDVIGKNGTIRFVLSKEQTRYFNGYFSRFVQTGYNRNFATYHATLVPWIWFL